jgi:hypothetical protein
MYATFTNQFIHLMHYAFSFIFVMVIMPKVIFTNKPNEDSLEQIIANYIKMVLFVILIGYALIVTKLFEVISLIAIWSFLAWRKYLRSRRQTKEEVFSSMNTWFYDYLDGLFRISRLTLNKIKATFLFWRYALIKRFSTTQAISEYIILVFVFISSIYYRFYDAMLHAAPTMSDGNVTLAWIKYNSSREIKNYFFHDGIYPQGFHIMMAVLHKFSAIDELYILKYTGPLNSIFLMTGLYFLVSRLTSRKAAGIVAAAAYGIFSITFSDSAWIRQAATNSQEFAFVFVFPSLYFFYKYIKEGKKDDYWVGAAGVAVCGLVHTLAQGFLGLGIFALLTSALLVNYRGNIRKAIEIILACTASIIIAAAPLGLGLLMGKGLNSSSATFLKSKNVIPMVLPTLHIADFIAIASMFTLFIYFWVTIRSRKEALLLLFSIFFISGTFLLYEVGGILTNSQLISARSIELWALILPYSMGMGFYVLTKVFSNYSFRASIELILSILLLFGAFAYAKPTPIVPYKMVSDVSVEQYLRISQLHNPKTWEIISQEEGYALVLGHGIHNYIANLLSDYDPTKPPLTKNGESGPDPKNLPPVDIYIFREKNIFKVSETNSIYSSQINTYKRREQEMKELEVWIQRYKAAGNPITTFYEDENLKIYHIHRTVSKEEKNNKIWGS